MKKILLFLSAAVASFSLHSQTPITITQADVAGVGKGILQAHDTAVTKTPGAMNPGPAGANQVWNFTTLTVGTLDTLTFTNPNWTPNGSNFPTSNLAMFNSADSSIAYLHNDSTGLFIQGIYAKINGWRVVHMTPSQEVCVFPATYGSTFSNASTLEFDMPYTSQPGVDSVRIKQTTVKNVTFDGWGSITTPLGTFNTLRNRGKVNTIDTIWAHIPTLSSWMQVSATNDSVWHFAWWAHNVGFSILEFDSTAADTLKNVDWLKVLPINNAVNELSFINGVSVYPNPASANVNFEIKNSKASTIELYNLTGEKISTVDVKRMNNTSFNVENFAPGVYFYTAIDMEGIPFARGKINVVR